jgi:hypothetical protein
VGSLPVVRRLRRSHIAVFLGWLALAHSEVSLSMQTASVLRAVAGTSATPLGRGVLIRASQAAPVDIEGTGAVDAAIVPDGTSFATFLASHVHDNPVAPLTIRSASARLAHNVVMRGR